MFGFSNLRVTWKIRILIGMSIVALAAFAWVSFSTLRALDINGPLYEEIAAKQDTEMDINPPVMNLLPSRVQVYMMLAETDADKREADLAQLHQIRKAYEDMLSENLQGLPEGKIKTLLSGSIHQSAVEYWDQVDQGLFPLLQKGDKKKIEEFRSKVLVPIAQRNAQAVEEIVELVREDKKRGGEISRSDREGAHLGHERRGVRFDRHHHARRVLHWEEHFRPPAEHRRPP